MAMKSIPQLPLAQFQPHAPLNHFFQVVTGGAGGGVTVYQGPSFRVPPGATVTLRPTNGGAVNVNESYVGHYPEQVKNRLCATLPAGADVSLPWPVENLNQIWMMAGGAAPDGILITVQESSVG